MKPLLTAILAAFSLISNAQEAEGLLDRLQAYKASDSLYYFNSDGVDVECILVPGEFTSENVAKTFKKMHLKARKLKADPQLIRPNFCEPGELLRAPNVYSTIDYYFVGENSVLYAFTFTSTHDVSREFERTLINLFLDHKIPEEVYQPKDMKHANFPGSLLDLSGECSWGKCYWQSPTDFKGRYTHIRWSSFKTKEKAELDKVHHLHYIEIEGNTINHKEEIQVQFEGQLVSATKVNILSPTVTPLIAYIIVAPVKESFVTCVIIYGLSKAVSEKEVPEIAAQIMKL